MGILCRHGATILSQQLGPADLESVYPAMYRSGRPDLTASGSSRVAMSARCDPRRCLCRTQRWSRAMSPTSTSRSHDTGLPNVAAPCLLGLDPLYLGLQGGFADLCCRCHACTDGPKNHPLGELALYRRGQAQGSPRNWYTPLEGVVARQLRFIHSHAFVR